jgi:hypothetical protein
MTAQTIILKLYQKVVKISAIKWLLNHTKCLIDSITDWLTDRYRIPGRLAEWLTVKLNLMSDCLTVGLLKFKISKERVPTRDDKPIEE